MLSSIKIGNSNYQPPYTKVNGKYVTLLGELYYCIENYDQIPPFFMSVVSNTDHWMFISSTGGLTAGRINAESALFPYETDDKIAESNQNTGPLSIFLVTRGGLTSIWEPFSDRYTGLYKIERKIFKNISGNKLIFEESNIDLGMTCRRSWCTSDRFGFILTTWLHNQFNDPVHIRLLSGVQNVLPFGVTTLLQSDFSNLLNAYKRNELEPESGLGIFSLSSTLTDLPEPSESLKATTVWQVGLENPVHLLSSMQLDDFRKGAEITNEIDIRGIRGAYLVNSSITLNGNEKTDWCLVLDANQDSADIAERVNMLKRPAKEIAGEIETDIAFGSLALKAIIASADGLQVSGDRLSSVHHYANVLFNTMRGGIFFDNYQIGKADLIDFLHTRNHSVLEQQTVFLDELPEKLNIADLLAHAGRSSDLDLERLCMEYLPLTFSRRHGDPSRPWNKFSINLKNADGSQRLDYQGNWRDLFQNWEALACSYPEYVESMISAFVNACTPDGFNPYRISREGVEWEVPEQENPWANIGYWSDHQIIYLEKLLEISTRYHPGKLSELLNKRVFCYVNVPYRLREYTSLMKDPYKTIDFDIDAHRQIKKDVALFGSDRKLIRSADGDIFHVTLCEKLLVLLLAKLVNFVPEGGIWMNTQRPEWNDANNALVGKGLSVVTLGYLRRYVVFWLSLLEGIDDTNLGVSREVKTLFDNFLPVLSQFSPNLSASFSNEERRTVMDALGQAGSDYRWNIYQQGFSGEIESLSVSKLISFLKLTCKYIEHSLLANRREDGLFHAYNILKLGNNTAEIGYLDEMLEGQVAILSSGLLPPQEVLILLQFLRESALYRADQHSYILYPDRDLPSFMVKNRFPSEQIREIKLVQELANSNESSLIVQDENGDFHFNGNFRNAFDVHQALERLGQQKSYADLVEADGEKILSLFEDVFHHESFTGRSGTFFAYEGLGSIYWHMVSKLLLAVQENFLLAIEREAEPETIQDLAECYYDIRKGLGFNKSPDVYGAFPTDPFSHTPKGQGAKQPGMTGQVKEEILTRQVEMGVFVRDGQISFDPILLREEEFITQPTTFEYFNLEGDSQRMELPKGSLAFTFCQTPVIYHIGEKSGMEIYFADGNMEEVSGSRLDLEISQHIFKRDGVILKIVMFMEQAR
ncbi:hypothetical protein ACFLYP_03515 [Chloroflexota bacterium]